MIPSMGPRWNARLRGPWSAARPGDLNHSRRELALARSVDLVKRRPPGYPGPRGLKRLHGSRGAATLSCYQRPMTAADIASAKTLMRMEMRAVRRNAAAACPDAAARAARLAPLDRLPAFSVAAGYAPRGAEL